MARFSCLVGLVPRGCRAETISAAQHPSPEVMTLSARPLTGSQAEKAGVITSKARTCSHHLRHDLNNDFLLFFQHKTKTLCKCNWINNSIREASWHGQMEGDEAERGRGCSDGRRQQRRSFLTERDQAGEGCSGAGWSGDGMKPQGHCGTARSPGPGNWAERAPGQSWLLTSRPP